MNRIHTLDRGQQLLEQLLLQVSAGLAPLGERGDAHNVANVVALHTSTATATTIATAITTAIATTAIADAIALGNRRNIQ